MWGTWSMPQGENMTGIKIEATKNEQKLEEGAGRGNREKKKRGIKPDVVTDLPLRPQTLN